MLTEERKKELIVEREKAVAEMDKKYPRVANIDLCVYLWEMNRTDLVNIYNQTKEGKYRFVLVEHLFFECPKSYEEIDFIDSQEKKDERWIVPSGDHDNLALEFIPA